MSHICSHCQENETIGDHKICDPCYDNAGDYLERNVERLRAFPYLLEACYAAVELQCPDGEDHECGTLAVIRDAIKMATVA